MRQIILCYATGPSFDFMLLKVHHISPTCLSWDSGQRLRPEAGGRIPERQFWSCSSASWRERIHTHTHTHTASVKWDIRPPPSTTALLEQVNRGVLCGDRDKMSSQMAIRQAKAGMAAVAEAETHTQVYKQTHTHTHTHTHPSVHSCIYHSNIHPSIHSSTFL